MLELLQGPKPMGHEPKNIENVAKPTAGELEVRRRQMLIDCISSLEDEDFARVWPRLITAVYVSQPPSQASARISHAARNPRSRLGILGAGI
jgi:hypothetical protein